MSKKLYYLFLMSLLSAFSVASAASNTGDEQPKDTTVEAPENVQMPLVSPEKPNVPTRPSFWQDINNHPFVWMFSAILFDILFVFLKLVDIDFSFLFFFANEGNLRKIEKEVLNSIIALAAFGVLSLLPACWANRWGNEGKKGEGFVIPSFKIRLWRSFRVALIPFVVSNVLRIPYIFELKTISKYMYLKLKYDSLEEFLLVVLYPTIIYLIASCVIFAYNYWRQGKNKEKKDLVSNS